MPVKIFDQQVPKGEERIRVYYLEHASAEDMAKVLQEIPTQTGKAKPQGKNETPLLSQKVHINVDKGYRNSDGVAQGTLSNGFSLEVLGKTFNVGGVTFPDIQAVVQVFQSDGETALR